MFDKMNLKSLLMLTLGISMMLVITVGGMGLYGINKTNTSLQTINNDRMLPVYQLGTIRALLMKNRMRLNASLGFRTVEENTLTLETVEKNKAEIDKLWTTYTHTYLTEEEKQLISKFVTARNAWVSNALQPAMAAIKVQNYDELSSILTTQARALFPAVEESLDQLIQLQTDVALLEYKASQDAYSLIIKAMMVLFMTGLAFMFIRGRHLINRIVGPMSRATDMVNAVAKGNLNGAIVIENKDEIGAMLQAFVPMQQTLRLLIEQMNHMAGEHNKGDIDVMIDASKFEGDFKNIASNINEMVKGHISVKKKAMACVKAFGEGNFDAPLEQFPGKKAFINDIIEHVRGDLKHLVDDATLLAKAGKEGNLSVRADASRHQGDFRKIIAGVNESLDAIVSPVQNTIEQVKSYSRGDISGELKGDFNGDFAELKKRLTYLSSTIKGVIDSVAYVKGQHDLGDIDVIIAAELFRGDFGVMATNINALMASHIALQKRVVEVVEHYGKGDFSIDMERLPGKKRHISTAVDGVKSSLGAMQTEITKLVDAALTGHLSARADTRKFDHSFKTMIEGINATLDAVVGPLNIAAGCVERIAHGDIPEKITDSYQGDFNIIKNNLNTCIDAINMLVSDTTMLSHAALDGRIQTRVDASRHQGDFRNIVEGINATLETIVAPIIVVKTAVDSISTAAREISAGNADLSHRTEQQAASLEQTASSMEELASTVKQNADNARQANQMASDASDVAVKGGSVVQQVVTTMSGINESARKIVDIISVIDGIALQTNILALNAAVEAARAGEQGRGFAVVASEVRNLAQRSAAAAKEIKALISDSVEKVEDGSKLVSEAGKTMNEIVVSVRRVTDIMSEIASASAEQSAGIDQVNQAVTQMDEVTQQNAALVEQAAAAAESLEEQAATLTDTVAQFRLDSEVRSPIQRRTPSLSVVSHKPVARQTARPMNTHKGGSAVAKLSQQNDEWTEF